MLKRQSIKLVIGLALILTLLFGGTLGAGLAADAASVHTHSLACGGENVPPCQ